MSKHYIFTSDPGHGWLQVPRAELERLGVAGQITPFSYQRGQAVYLEEDCDMSVFLKAKERAGEPVEIVTYSVSSTPIRGYAPYSRSPAKQPAPKQSVPEMAP